VAFTAPLTAAFAAFVSFAACFHTPHPHHINARCHRLSLCGLLPFNSVPSSRLQLQPRHKFRGPSFSAFHTHYLQAHHAPHSARIICLPHHHTTVWAPPTTAPISVPLNAALRWHSSWACRQYSAATTPFCQGRMPIRVFGLPTPRTTLHPRAPFRYCGLRACLRRIYMYWLLPACLHSPLSHPPVYSACSPPVPGPPALTAHFLDRTPDSCPPGQSLLTRLGDLAGGLSRQACPGAIRPTCRALPFLNTQPSTCFCAPHLDTTYTTSPLPPSLFRRMALAPRQLLPSRHTIMFKTYPTTRTYTACGLRDTHITSYFFFFLYRIQFRSAFDWHFPRLKFLPHLFLSGQAFMHTLPVRGSCI